MSAFVCARCKAQVRNPYDKYQERTEYVRIDGRHRAWVFAMRDLCRACVEEMKADAKHATTFEQMELGIGNDGNG